MICLYFLSGFTVFYTFILLKILSEAFFYFFLVFKIFFYYFLLFFFHLYLVFFFSLNLLLLLLTHWQPMFYSFFSFFTDFAHSFLDFSLKFILFFLITASNYLLNRSLFIHTLFIPYFCRKYQIVSIVCRFF